MGVQGVGGWVGLGVGGVGGVGGRGWGSDFIIKAKFLKKKLIRNK